MVKRFINKRNPSKYFPGDNVYIRISKGRKKEQFPGKIIIANHSKHTYKVQMDNGNVMSCKESDIATLTREEELHRRSNFCRNRIKSPCQCENDNCKTFASYFCSKAMSKNCCIKSCHVCQNREHNREKKGIRLSDFLCDEKDDFLQ